jgi:general secretion pathway protein D
MQERQEFLDRYFVFNEDSQYHTPHDYSRTKGLTEEVRRGYLEVAERKRLDEAARPKEFRGHVPGEPLEMPASVHASGGAGAPPGPEPPNAGGGAPAEPAKPPINVRPPPRGVDRIEK